MTTKKRPILLQLLPDRFRVSVWSRFYRGRHDQYRSLYDMASLKYAPGIHMRLVPGDVISDSIAFTGIYELKLTRRMRELASQGGTMIEIGANLGYFSLLWAAANLKSQVVAFEASPRNIELLKFNITSNSLEQRIAVAPVAAGETAGKLTFDIGPESQTGWGGFTLQSEVGHLEVDVVRVDEYLNTDESVELLKVDIEGADTWALKGCDRLLKASRIKEIWYEQNKPRMRLLGIHLDEAQDYLDSVGYRARPESDPAGEVVEWSAMPKSQR